MLIGVYGDVHVSKNMRSLQQLWDKTATESLRYMYDKFDELDVESVVCLGDFFDAPRIEAKNMQLVMPILDYINSRTYPTYILLGNHEIDSTESNILDFLSMYKNIIPMTHAMDIEGMLFIPYSEDPQLYDMKDRIVFTHHDIYGSQLAGGKNKAFFGLDPSVFKDAKLVMNGHVHLKSRPAHNIVNAGSILVSQQGELKLGDYPSYYTLDNKTADLKEYENIYSMIYLTIGENDTNKISSRYMSDNLVLRVEYEGEIPKDFMYTERVSWRKKISSIGSTTETKVSDRNFDLKNYLTEYIKNDESVSDKEGYISAGMRLLG